MKNQKLISRNVIRRFLNGTGSSGVLRENSISSKDIIDIRGSKYLILGDNELVPLYTNKSSNYPSSITSSDGKVTYYYNPRSAFLAGYSDLKKIKDHYKQNENKYYNTNVSTSGNIFSQQYTNDGKFTLSKIKNFRDSVIDYQNSHSTNDDVKFTIPLGNVPINENDLLIRETIPDVETRYTMPKSLFNITRNSVSSTPILVSNSNLPHITVPSLADVKYTPRQTTSSTTTTSSSTQEPKLFTIKEKDSEFKFNRKDMEDELVFMNLLTKDEAKNKSNEEIVNLFLDYINKNVALLNKEPSKQKEKKELEITTPVRTIPYNRADIRSLIRNGGYNPYSDYSAGLRRKLRKYLNKEDNQLYEDWMAPFVVFKKKGGLLSRNTVIRFKNKI